MSDSVKLRNRRRLVARKVIPIDPHSGQLTDDYNKLMSVKGMKEFRSKQERMAEQRAAIEDRDHGKATEFRAGVSRDEPSKLSAFGRFVSAIQANAERESSEA